MTDYLEELLENTGALLEQVRRMDREGGAPVSQGALPSPAPAAGPSQAEHRATQGTPSPEEDTSQKEPSPPSPQGQPDLEIPRRVPTPLEEGPDPSPLLEQLQRLERAAAFSPPAAGQAAGQRGGSFPLALSKSGGGSLFPNLEDLPGQSAGGEPAAALPLSGGGLDWAQQADRAFRRDSRRYDGGFYLY